MASTRCALGLPGTNCTRVGGRTPVRASGRNGGARTFPPAARRVGHFRHIIPSGVIQVGQEGRVAPVFFIHRDPLERKHVADTERFQHRPSQLRFGLKRRVLGNTALLPPFAMVVGKPFTMEIQAAVKEGVSFGTSIDEYDTGLAVGDFAEGTTILACYADGVVTLLGKVAAVQNHHASGCAQRFGDDGLVDAQNRRAHPSRLRH